MKIANKTVTATRLVKDALAKAEHFNKTHNIFTSINTEGALRAAATIDAKIAQGRPVGRLAGVTYALKDNFLSKAGKTTASSKILANFKSPMVSTVVKLLEAEGAIMIGRTNLDSFAHGSSTENSFFGPTKNAADPTRVAGGSSGGSAVAVALDIVEFATGTDTGGSIRQPAAFNGVYGLKPTYGATSRFGVVPMASSLDSIGFFAHSAADLDLLMQITAKPDPLDSTSIPLFYHTYSDLSIGDTAKPTKHVENSTEAAENSTKTANSPNSPKTIALVKEFDSSALDPAVKDTLDRTVSALQSAGHKIITLSIPELQYALAAYYVIVPVEVASNLARHDGICYGYRAGTTPEVFVQSRLPGGLKPEDFELEEIEAMDLPKPRPAGLEAVYSLSRSLGFMPENQRRIMIGNYFLFSGGYEKYFLQAAKVRTKIISAYQTAFKRCDFLLTPVSPNPAFSLGSKAENPVAMYLEDLMSAGVNLAGLPALAFPTGKTASGLPLGLQLVGPARSDAEVIAFTSKIAELL